MSTLGHAVSDSATMLRRNLRHAQRYPSMTLAIIGMPVMFMLLFVYVLGGALGSGIGGSAYIDYLAPGILLMTVSLGSVSTAVAVCTDMSEGIIDRFRTMRISRASVLTGHVIGSVIQTMLSVVFVVAIALLVGFRPTAGIVEWIAAMGVIALVALAVTWLSVALGLLSKTAEGASNIVTPIAFLPFTGSTFVPTDSMSAGIRWWAEYQPATPILETIRGLLMGTSIGGSGPLAIAWCLVLALAGYLWARRLYARDPA